MRRLDRDGPWRRVAGDLRDSASAAPALLLLPEPAIAPAAAEPQPDPGDPQAAINRYREVAKYLITIFAGVGALLVAGSQLSAVGKLSWEDTPERVLAAAIGLLVAICAIAWIVGQAVKILRPVEMSLDDVVADPTLAAAVNARPSYLSGIASVAALKESLDRGALPDEFEGLADDIVEFAAYKCAQQRFDDAWRRMLGGALVGTVGIVAFAWGSNPPEDTTEPVVRPAPVLVEFELTGEGRRTLNDALGAECVKRPVRALTVGGKEGAPRVVTLPERGCKAAQFVLAEEWGAVLSTESAPAK